MLPVHGREWKLLVNGNCGRSEDGLADRANDIHADLNAGLLLLGGKILQVVVELLVVVEVL